MYREGKLLIDTTPKTFTPDLRGLVAWLETQNPATEYDFDDTHDCLLCRFSKENGYWRGEYGATCAGFGEEQWAMASAAIEGSRGYRKHHGYGAALERARAQLK